MKNDLPQALNRDELLTALHQWVNQRPGLDPRNYIRDWSDQDGRRAYFSESRSITRDLHHARALLRYVEMRDSITAADIINASRHSFAGRLAIVPLENGKFSIEYCTGQYWPTEYRRAAAAVLAAAIWEWLRTNTPDATGDKLRQAARRELGRPLAARFFN